MGRIAPLGLRTRLIAAFLLVAAICAVTTAALTYQQARTAILKQTQDTAVSTLRDQIDNQAVQLPFDRPQLQSMVTELGRRGKPHSWVVYGEYGDLKATSNNPGGPLASPLVGEGFREQIRHTRSGAFQRVRDGEGNAMLAVGMPAVFVHDGSNRPTGAVFYAVMPLNTEEQTVSAMVDAAQQGAVPGLAIAVVPALLAARSVLRPVRRLRTAAQQMGRGQLDTRIEVRGADELAGLARTFNETAGALERSVEELRQAEVRARRFASDVSHELRTPLAGMLAVTEVLDEDAESLDPDTAKALRLISAETGKLAVLVEDLMEISRFDARAAELNLDDVDVAEAVGKTLERRHWDDDRVSAELPPRVRARLDPRRFDVILANLVGNALRHGGAPVRITVTAPPRPDGDRLVIEVADSGPGIAPEVLPHIFDRFFKADAARTRSAGSGLGLAITLENVRLHGGTLHAANGADGGAVFTLDMPLEARA
ncbi:ATP-binding protein [Streptomyces sp. NPDC060334]|uniref:sensor histidine kinase n=1 Tax=unclassified Streptomyces TaxID=2593676 RepID=UPI0006B02E7C|nr:MULTISPECIES: HAMP domain-containing sensor histidine kinase [unclassified Streptomyces]MCX5072599.1 HAMP domain-containing histidine kinase [Streptomyces sp. NBC_00424]MCX5155866.1 HAMP domain-containing histidine kinase [Streptomyces sp. NBC_00291]WUD44082.1 HAMP domain-containing histidine kinase [Streptomyces sp. NBC_00513]